MPTQTLSNFSVSRIFINRNFLFLWVGQVLSTLGDTLFQTTLILWIVTSLVRNQSLLAFAVSGVILAGALPRFLVQPFAGVFVDRWNRRKTMLCMDACRMLFTTLLLPISGVLSIPFFSRVQLSLNLRLGIIYAVLTITSICSQFFTPAQFALIGEIVPTPKLANASGLNLILTNLATIVGPSLAAPLFLLYGVQWAIGFNALSFFFSFLLLLFVRSPQFARNANNGQHMNVLHEFIEGIQLLMKNNILRTLAFSLMIAMFGLGAMNTLEVFFLPQNLHTSPSFYGFLTAAFGVGSIVGALLATPLVPRFGFIRSFWGSMILVGVIVCILSRMTSFLPALMLYGLLGVPNAANNVALEPLLLQNTPKAYIGRVFAVLTPCWTLVYVISVALAGYVEGTLLRHFHVVVSGIVFGPIDSIFLGTGILVIVGGIYAMKSLSVVR